MLLKQSLWIWFLLWIPLKESICQKNQSRSTILCSSTFLEFTYSKWLKSHTSLFPELGNSHAKHNNRNNLLHEIFTVWTSQMAHKVLRWKLDALFAATRQNSAVKKSPVLINSRKSSVGKPTTATDSKQNSLEFSVARQRDLHNSNRVLRCLELIQKQHAFSRGAGRKFRIYKMNPSRLCVASGRAVF